MYYYVIAGHDSVRILVDENGNITDTYSYDTYGELTDRSGTTDNSYLYSGEYRDATTGLYYLRARYMDAETGRFITADSYQGRLSDPVSLHKYLYANANPVMYADPSGYMVAEVISTSAAIAIIGTSVANAIALSIGLNLYQQLRLKDEYGTTIDIGSLLADAFMSGCIAAGFAAAAILGASLGSVAVMVAIGGSSLIFALLSLIAAYQAGECGYDDLALIYIILGCAGLYGADRCFDGAMNISKSQTNASSNSTTSVDNSMIENANRCGSAIDSGKNKNGSNVYIPKDADGNPIPLRKQNMNGQDIPLPDPAAEGRPHTVIGGKVSSKTGELYRQTATFPEGTWPKANGQNVPWSEVHWTNHGTSCYHTNPHQHVFEYNPDKGGWIRQGPTPYYE